MHRIDLTPGSQNADGEHAFDSTKMEAAGLDAVTLINAAAERLGPFAALLNDGCGLAVIVNADGKATVTGIAVTPK